MSNSDLEALSQVALSFSVLKDELQAIARVADLPLLEKVARKRSLPPELRDLVEDRRNRLEREEGAVLVPYSG